MDINSEIERILEKATGRDLTDDEVERVENLTERFYEEIQKKADAE